MVFGRKLSAPNRAAGFVSGSLYGKPRLKVQTGQKRPGLAPMGSDLGVFEEPPSNAS